MEAIEYSKNMCGYDSRWALYISHSGIQFCINEEHRCERGFGARLSEILEVTSGPLHILRKKTDSKIWSWNVMDKLWIYFMLLSEWARDGEGVDSCCQRDILDFLQ